MALYQVSAGDRILAADINQFYSILKGVAASGEAVTLIYNAAGVLALIPSSDPAAGTELIQVKNAAATVQSALSSDGRYYSADGLVGTPGVSFEQDKDNGLYRVTTNVVGMAAGGAEKMRWDSTGVSLDGGSTYLGAGTSIGITNWQWSWTPGMTMESTVTGTGAYNVVAPRNEAQLVTGATSGSTAGIRSVLTITDTLTGALNVNRLRVWSFLCDFNEYDANTVAKIYLTDENVTGNPSDTARHIGLRSTTASTLLFSTADNTTEQTTNITSFVTAATQVNVVVTFDGTTAKCYINGTLRATHATNVPGAVSNVGPVFRGYITNSAAASKNLFMGVHTAIFANT